MITILAMGQSNMAGAGTGGVWSFPASVTAWNCTADTDALTGLGSAWVAPVRTSAPFNGFNNMAAHACRYIAAETCEDVRLILVAKSGTSIASWVSGAMYARMEAVLAAAGVSSVDLLLWQQGEADSASPSTYAAQWSSLVSRLETDGYVGAETPIVMGELYCTLSAMNAVLRSIATSRIGLADIACFPTQANLHFTGPSLVRAGLEMAREYLKLTGADCEDDDRPYVTAAGCCDFTAPTGVATKIPVKAENGKKSLIQGGCFVSDHIGVVEIQAQARPLREKWGIWLLDDGGDPIQYLTSTGAADPTNNNAAVSGSTVIAVGKGDKLALGVAHSGASITVPAVTSAIWNRLTVRYLDRD